MMNYRRSRSRGRRPLLSVLAVLAVLVASCTAETNDPALVSTTGENTATEADAAADTAAPAGTAAAAVSGQDPYEVYLRLVDELGITDAPNNLTRDDAQLRALLGCGTAWAPGTVDAALAQAYAPFIEQWKTEGSCG